MNVEQFYLTLSSESNCEYQQSNDTATFRVNLGNPINLIGKWEVCLFECFYPLTLSNLRKNACSIFRTNVATLANEKVFQAITHYALESKYYHTNKQLIDTLNEEMVHMLNCTMTDGFVSLNCYETNVVREEIEICLADELKDILGFSRDIKITPGTIITGQAPCDVKKGLPKTLSVLTDIIGEQLVNNSHSKVLRTFPVDAQKYSFGYEAKVDFSKLVFLPVVKSKLDSIEIQIKEDVSDHKASFQHGTFTVVLLFRRTE
jgi:hypothetical protein